MFTKNKGGVSALLLVILILSVAAISCGRLKALTNTQSEKINRFNFSLPHGMVGAERDDDIYNDPSRVVLLPEPGQIMIGTLDSEPVDVKTLGARLADAFRGATEDKNVVYIAAAYDIPDAEVIEILGELSKNDVRAVRFLASGRSEISDSRGNSSVYEAAMGDVPAPDRVLEITLREPVLPDETDDELTVVRREIPRKPNPLTLVVSPCGAGGQVCLNAEPFGDVDVLANKLREVFRERERNGVFRENSNEVEKAVHVRIGNPARPGEPFISVLRMINAVKIAGAEPVRLADYSGKLLPGNDFMLPDRTIDLESEPPRPLPVPRSLPKTVSGGVLNGKATSLPKPAYPPAARSAGASGSVSVQVTVDPTGKVVKAEAVSGHALLRAAATAAAREATFSPTLLSGQPVSVTGVLIYNFSGP